MPPKNIISCPSCGDTKVETAALAYQTIKSKDAGQRFLLQNVPVHHPIGEKKRDELLKKLAPPHEPKINLPAASIALMAFLISWLATGSLIIGKIGQRNYFIISMMIVGVISIAFYYMLSSALISFKGSSTSYFKRKTEWEKQYFCRKCYHIFIP